VSHEKIQTVLVDHTSELVEDLMPRRKNHHYGGYVCRTKVDKTDPLAMGALVEIGPQWVVALERRLV
jgi:hypothetical protein